MTPTASERLKTQIVSATAKIPALVLAIKHGDPSALAELCAIIEAADAASFGSDPDHYALKKWTAQTGATINQLARNVAAPIATQPPTDAIKTAQRNNDPDAARNAGKALAHEPPESVAACIAGLLASISRSNPEGVAWIAYFLLGWIEAERSAEEATAWQIAQALDAANLGKMANAVRKSTRSIAIKDAANLGAADALLTSEAKDCASILTLIEDEGLRQSYTAKQLARTVENEREKIGQRITRALSNGWDNWSAVFEAIEGTKGERIYIARLDNEYGLAQALKNCPSWQRLRQIMALEKAPQYIKTNPSAAHSAALEIIETAAKNPEAKFVLKALADKYKSPVQNWAERNTQAIIDDIKSTLAGFGAYIDTRRLVWL